MNPILKSGGQNGMANYRPVSVLPILSEVFEKCILCWLLPLMNKFSIVCHCKFGFRKDMSTMDAVVEFIVYINRFR